jgi:hypothetical protein
LPDRARLIYSRFLAHSGNAFGGRHGIFLNSVHVFRCAINYCDFADKHNANRPKRQDGLADGGYFGCFEIVNRYTCSLNFADEYLVFAMQFKTDAAIASRSPIAIGQIKIDGRGYGHNLTLA